MFRAIENRTESQWREVLKEINPSVTRNRTLDEYSALLGVAIRDIAYHAIVETGHFRWIDMACGQFTAGTELSRELILSGIHSAIIEGVDLDPPDTAELPIYNENISSFPIPADATLVTSLFGLRYVEMFARSSRQTIINWYNNAPTGCILAFQLPDQFPANSLNGLSEALGNNMTHGITQTFRDAKRRMVKDEAHSVRIIKPQEIPYISLE